MSFPPQGPYGSQPSDGGPQWGGPPPQGSGGQPPYAGGGPAGQPQGAPQYGQQGGPWPQQQPWGAPPSPPNKGGKGKWILLGLALIAVIAVSVVGTVLVLRPDSGGGQAGTDSGGSEFASANDTGPANIITEEPTCEAWVKIAHDMDAAAPDWNRQDYSLPATEWSPEQRTVFDKKSAALAVAVDKAANLAKQTPHRVMRELYGQYIAYAQAVIDSIPSYSSTDNQIVAASNQFFTALNRVCDAIHYRAAQQTAPLIPVPESPSNIQAFNRDSALESKPFLDTYNNVCSDWIAKAEQFDKDSQEWRGIDSKISATEWTPDQKAVMDAVAPAMTAYANDMERLGRESKNPVWEDFAVFTAQNMRAYVEVIPTYTVNAGYMASVSTRLANAIYWACKAAS